MGEPNARGTRGRATAVARKTSTAPHAVGPIKGAKAPAPTGASKSTAAKRSRASTSTPATKSAASEAPAPSKRTGSARTTAWNAQFRADAVVRVLGNRRAAALLGVSESQPSRWRTEAEVPGAKVAPALIDLDHIVARLQLLWDEEVIGDWLEGANAFLGGARPIDVLIADGSAPVLEAIEAEASGAYA